MPFYTLKKNACINRRKLLLNKLIQTAHSNSLFVMPYYTLRLSRDIIATTTVNAIADAINPDSTELVTPNTK